MKTRKLCFSFILVALIFMLAACNKSNKIAIRFNSVGGSTVEMIEFEPGAGITKPQDPTKTGYSFDGWYSDNRYTNLFDFTIEPSQNILLFAKWSLKNYTITYELSGGTNNTSNPQTYNISYTNFNLLNPTYTGHNFEGWFSDSSFTIPVTEITVANAQDITLYAKWSAAQVVDYTITYHLSGGTNGMNPTTFNYEDETITLQPATKQGSEFVGWFSDEALTNRIETISTSLTSNIDVYAKFIENQTYTLKYHMNNGVNSSKNPDKYSTDMGSITLEAPTKTSATFAGWYYDEEFTKPVSTIDCSKAKNYDLYAKWENAIVVRTFEFDFGIGKEYKILQISDTHITAGTSSRDLKAENDWINNSRYGFADSFGESYDKDVLFSSSTENFKNLVRYINSQNPDAVCCTGDLMDEYTQANFNFIDTEIAKINAPHTYSIGNHEQPAVLYKGVNGTDTVDFTVIEFEDFIIVSLQNGTSGDFNYYYTEEQYQSLLAETKKNKPIIIAMHVPILTEENCTTRLEDCGTYFYIDVNSCDVATKKVVDLICENENIKLVITGHVHGQTLTYIAPNKPQITCSSGLIGSITEIIIR